MKPWLRRLLYLLIVLVWLLVMAFPIFAVVLASRGEIQLGDDPANNSRVFLIQEADAEGIGIQTIRETGDDLVCSETSVTYLMWKGEGENSRFCSCAASGASFSGRCP
ncbi:MAG: hypothetical protein KDE04_10670 [Anaerolineales bacterium]|nr:hypothetical protein [Anaerolineales bacterium]